MKDVRRHQRRYGQVEEGVFEYHLPYDEVLWISYRPTDCPWNYIADTGNQPVGQLHIPYGGVSMFIAA